MKKFLFLMLFAFTSIFASAVPSGCYRGLWDCNMYISGNELHILNRNGKVSARWTIVSEDNDGNFTLRSEYGVERTGKWWREDGKVYVYCLAQSFEKE